MTHTRRGSAILGFSGLALHRRFRETQLSGITSLEKAIFQGADAAAALVINERIAAAAAEERFDGTKHSSAFPRGAAEYCLATSDLHADDLDIVAHSFPTPSQKNFIAVNRLIIAICANLSLTQISTERLQRMHSAWIFHASAAPPRSRGKRVFSERYFDAAPHENVIDQHRYERLRLGTALRAYTCLPDTDGQEYDLP